VRYGFAVLSLSRLLSPAAISHENQPVICKLRQRLYLNGYGKEGAADPLVGLSVAGNELLSRQSRLPANDDENSLLGRKGDEQEQQIEDFARRFCGSCAIAGVNT
jgi:hypothetical protein